MAARDLFVWFTDNKQHRLVVGSVLDDKARFIIVEANGSDDDNLAVDLTREQVASLAKELGQWLASFERGDA
jgi:hypothetical protein